MGCYILPGNPPVEVNVRVSARARRYALRVSDLDGRVTLTLPAFADPEEGFAFARSRADWIRSSLARRAPDVWVEMGTVLPIEGVPHRVTPTPGRRATVADGCLLVPRTPHLIGVRAEAALKLLARDRLAEASDAAAAALGRPFGRMTLRDTRSRWGSCSSRGDLMYSWRLIMAPPDVLTYVAAHEVAHLAEMNHGPRFWARVAELCPGYEAPRAWLRREGAALHRYRFRN